MTTQRAVAREVAAEQGTGRGEVVLYRTSDGTVGMDVRLEQDTVWLSQKQMAQLFDTERSVVTKHVRNVFASGELDKGSVCAFFAHTAEDGKSYETLFYNLDVIIAVGYSYTRTSSDPADAPQSPAVLVACDGRMLRDEVRELDAGDHRYAMDLRSV